MKSDHKFAIRKNRIIILGAGFSVEAGLPLASKLWKEIIDSAKAYGNGHRANKFFDDIENYLIFKRDTTGQIINLEDIDFEDFMQYLDLEHFHDLRGGDTWSEDGNEGTIVVKHFIGKIISNYMNKIKNIPDIYLEFARRLDFGDTVFTFNYDTLLETALDAVGKPYRLVPFRFREVSLHGDGEFNPNDNEVKIYKVHGSIDWFDRAPFDRVFSRTSELQLESLYGGACPSDDPLHDTMRVRNLKNLHDIDLIFYSTPKLLVPSAAKLLYILKVGNFWRGWNGAGIYNYGLSIVGFSLPMHDNYVRQILYSLVKNYQYFDNANPDELGITRPPLVIVDCFSGSRLEEAFKLNYRFVDWNRAKLYGNGFSFDCLDSIFGKL